MQVTFFKAIYYSNAATATVLQYTMPAILLLMYLVKDWRLPTRREVVAVVLALLGDGPDCHQGAGGGPGGFRGSRCSTASWEPSAWPSIRPMRRCC